MMDNYDVFAATYNDTIEPIRKEIKEKALKAGIEPDYGDYQTLKPTHRALFNDLVLELGKKMFQNIRNYEKIHTEQGGQGTFSLLSNKICGDGVFVCSTNRYQLSKHNAKELSTVYRNILRLMEAGIITRKVGHGKKANFELHINAEFLLVSDKANPDYNPLNSPKTATTKDFSLCAEIAECKEEKNVQEHLINKIYSAGADFNSNGSESTTNDAAVLDLKSIVKNFEVKAGTLTGTEGMPTVEANSGGKTAQMKPAGGAWDVQNMMNDREIDYVKVFSKKEPKQWHGFHRLSYAAYFVDYTIQALYSRRGVEIFPLARIAAIEYAEKFYFPDPFGNGVKTPFKPCETVESYANRLNQLTHLAAKQPIRLNNSFILVKYRSKSMFF
jgi:hypothetical protein